MVQSYEELIRKESLHWGNVQPDPENPQIWDDPKLYEIFFGQENSHLIGRVVANGPRVLELGCGEGNLAIQLSHRGLDVTALDLSPERIQRAEEKSENLSKPPRFRVADLNLETLPRSEYDCIVANGSLHHILALNHLLDEIKNSLKPSGRFLIFDYLGMGFMRKSMAAILYAVLPTYKPYSAKWRLKSRLRAFLSSEKQKRAAISQDSGSLLHPGSPFEEISGSWILKETARRFKIIDIIYYHPFFFYLAAKIRTPRFMRYSLAGILREMDDFLIRSHIARGSYVFIEALKG